MKKFLTLVLLIGVAVVGSSCKKEVTQVIESDNRTIIYNVQENDWAPNNAQTTYSTTLDVPEIDNYLHDNGAVLVYGMSQNGIYEQFPQVYNAISYSYSYVNGAIQIDAQYSDGGNFPAADRPPGMKIKVVLIDSNPID